MVQKYAWKGAAAVNNKTQQQREGREDGARNETTGAESRLNEVQSTLTQMQINCNRTKQHHQATKTEEVQSFPLRVAHRSGPSTSAAARPADVAPQAPICILVSDPLDINPVKVARGFWRIPLKFRPRVPLLLSPGVPSTLLHSTTPSLVMTIPSQNYHHRTLLLKCWGHLR